jgi:preprotein translocase subunit YajC
MDMLLFIQDAAAPAAGAPAAGPGLGGMMIPLVLMFVVMYFLMIKPQNKERKKREAMIANLKKNDHVFTSSGIYGIVKQIKPDDTYLTICVDERNDVCIRVSKASVAGLEGDAAAEAKAEQPKTDAAEKKS